MPNPMKMAWQSSGTSNTDLITQLTSHSLITIPRVRDAFLAVDRAHYSPTAPYEDSPQYIGHGATISAPHMHAAAVENLLPFLLPPPPPPPPPHHHSGKEGKPTRPRRILDIGSGSGYLTHVMAELVGPGEGRVVVGVEHIPQLAEMATTNMRKSAEGRALLESGRVKFVVGDGRKGWVDERTGPGDEGAQEGLWDAIHVGASAVTLHPELVAQLRAPGRMFIPVDDNSDDDDDTNGRIHGGGQHIWAVDKDAKGNVSKKKLFAVRYVPLTDAPKR